MIRETNFKQQVVQLQDNLKRLAIKLTSDHDRANDLVQDTTLKALDNEHRYSTDDNFKGWMFTIMRNIFVNNYHRNRRQTLFDDLTADKTISLPTESTIEEIYNYKEIGKIIGSFPQELSRPFTLYMRGYKYKEIAKMTETPVGTVKSRIHTLRHRLRSILKDYK